MKHFIAIWIDWTNFFHKFKNLKQIENMLEEGCYKIYISYSQYPFCKGMIKIGFQVREFELNYCNNQILVKKESQQFHIEMIKYFSFGKI